MSVQAITWALEDAPAVVPGLVSTLIGLANHADRDGCGARPSTDTLTEYTRKSFRQVRRDLDDLEAAGLIRPGDPALVAHIRADRRPQVWDLATERKRSRGNAGERRHKPNGGTPTTPRNGPREDTHDVPYGRTPTTPRNGPREDTHDVPQTGDGGSWVTERGVMGDRHGGSPMTPEPKEEPSMNRKPPPSACHGESPRGRAREVGRPAGRTEHPSPAELNATAVRPDSYRLVTAWAEKTTGVTTGHRRRLNKAVDELLAQRADPELIPAALDEAHRPQWRDPARSLSSAYDRVRRDAHPSPPAPPRTQPRESTTDRAVAEVTSAFDQALGRDRNGYHSLPGDM